MAESELEGRLNNKILRLQGQINALEAYVKRLHGQITHPSVLARIKEYQKTTSGGDILGTANQVNVTNGADCLAKVSDVVLSLPQDIDVGATPEFGGLTLTGNIDIDGNYTLKWWNNDGTVQYCYFIASGSGLVISAVNVPFQIQYGTLGSKVALSITSVGDVVWNYEAADADFSIKKKTAGVAYYYNAGTDIHTFSGAVGIETTSPDASSILHLSSTTKGFLPPVMTGAEAEAITTPATGLLVYASSAGSGDITSSGWWGFNGANWVKLG